jgi:hypothetical protein
MPETRAFSRQLVVYIAAFPPSAPYFKSNNGRISAVCNEQYSFTCRAEALFVSDDEEGADLILPDNRTSPTLELETLGGRLAVEMGQQKWMRHPLARLQDFSPLLSGLPSSESPMQGGMLTLKSFMIPYPKLGDLPPDIAGGLAMISSSISS